MSPVFCCRKNTLVNADGLQLELVTADSTGRTPPHARILFVHGMWHGAWCWQEYFFEYFTERGYQVAAISLRGHGQSQRGKRQRPYRLKDYVQDVQSALDHLSDGRPLIVVGHSLGGLLTQHVLQWRRVRLAVLLASLPPTGILRAALRFIRAFPRHSLRILVTCNLKAGQEPAVVDRLLFSHRLDELVGDRYRELLASESFLVFLQAFNPWFVCPQLVTSPVAVIGSDADHYVSVNQLIATARAYGVTPHVIPGIGHDMMLDPQWRDVAETLERIIEGEISPHNHGVTENRGLATAAGCVPDGPLTHACYSS